MKFTLVMRLCLLLSPQRTAFNIPTAAVVWRSRPCPTWSACARVRSSKSTSRASKDRGKYWRFYKNIYMWGFKSNMKFFFLTLSSLIPVRFRLTGDLFAFNSAVGSICSPGRIQRMGPSLDSNGLSILTTLVSPQGIVNLRNTFFSSISRNLGKYPPTSSVTVPTSEIWCKGPWRKVPPLNVL